MPVSGLTHQQVKSSAYLREIAKEYPKKDSLEDIFSKISSANASELLDLKSQFALCWAQTHFPSFDARGQKWSDFADKTIDRALELAWERTAKRYKIEIPSNGPKGLFILGLGKLGGHDLNFSSDVDLIAFFDTETFPVPEHKGQAFIASDMCKRLTQILQPRNAPHFIWRVDWRLRPESSGTGLAMSTEKAETFYFFRSLPWHRLALMKARCVAGDKMAGHKYLERLEPYIWRRNLDFTTLDELAAIKTRINNEHPGLEYERAAPAPITPQASGFNLKLGRGGIREIEFVANAQQLIHGGKRPALRVTQTRSALTQLAETGLLSKEDAENLRTDYRAFREIENAVQMLSNEQAHIVPEGEPLEDLMVLLNHPAEFHKIIYDRRQRVHAIFSRLFEETPKETKTPNLSKLKGAATKIALSWCNGFQDHGLSLSQQSKYKELGQGLSSRIMSQPREDIAFQRVDDFLKQLGRSEPYFALLNRNPDLLDRLITPLLHSPHMSEILRQSPHIIDIFLAANSESLAEQSKFVLTSPDYEHRLEALRRFVNEQLFLSYTHFLEGTREARETQSELTALAEQTLTLAIQIVTVDLDIAHIPMTVLGLGKMGTRAMSPKSDLDLIFIFDDTVDSELAAKIVQRMRTTLMVKLREGIAYELDMRLRPSGRSGPPAVKLASFREHHMKRAHSWEHIALAPARIVAGDVELGQEVMEIKSEIFNRPRDISAFKADAYAMYQRLASERLQNTSLDIWRTKLRTGGLMTADYIRSCQAVAGYKEDPDLQRAIRRWNELQLWERLLGLKGKPIGDTPSRFTNAVNIDTLRTDHEELEKQVKQSFNAFFENTQNPSPSDPRPVMWKN